MTQVVEPVKVRIPEMPRWLRFALKEVGIEATPKSYSINRNSYDYSLRSLKNNSYGRVSPSQINALSRLLARRGFSNSVTPYSGQPAIIRIMNGWEIRAVDQELSSSVARSCIGYTGEYLGSRLHRFERVTP